MLVAFDSLGVAIVELSVLLELVVLVDSTGEDVVASSNNECQIQIRPKYKIVYRIWGPSLSYFPS